MEAALREALNAPLDTPQDLIESAMGQELPVQELRAASALLLAGGAPTELRAAQIISDTLNAASATDKFEIYKALFLTDKGQPRAKNPYNKPTEQASPLLPELFQIKDGSGSETERILELAEKLKAAESLQRTRALLRVGLPALEGYVQLKQGARES